MKKLVFFPSDPMGAYFEKGYSYDHLANRYNPAGYFDEIYCLSPWKSPMDTIGKIKCIQAKPWQFKRIIKKISPDVVWAYGGYCASDWAAISKVEGIPTIVSLHDTNPNLIHESVKFADVIVCMSKSVQAAAEHKLGLEGKAMYILPNRVDVELFCHKEPNEKAEELTKRFGEGKHILHIGRKAEQKNLDTVIKALVLLDNSYKMIFVGQGDASPYEQLAVQCGVADRCYFIESVPNNELPYWYSWCDCMCTPSRWEGFGIVFIEAASCEAAIVTSNIGPMNEYLSQDTAVLVDDFENPVAIASAVKMAVEGDSEHILQMRKNARRVGLRFSKDSVDTQEIAILEKTMQMQLVDSVMPTNFYRLKYIWNENLAEFKRIFPVKSFIKKVFRKIKVTAVSYIIHSRPYIHRKEAKEYSQFLNAFKFDYFSKCELSPYSECFYRNTYFNSRNKLLVQMCKENDLDGISAWYKEADADKMFFDEYFENRMSMRIIARHIIETQRKGAYILDAACGHGSIDKELAKHGFKVKGIDLNPDRVNYLRPYVFAAECKDIDHTDEENTFDIILSMEMLEHVPNVRKTLQRLFELLVPEGLLYLAVPNAYRIDDEKHVRIFTKDSLILLLKEAGFQVNLILPLAYLNHEHENDLVCVCKKPVR